MPDPILVIEQNKVHEFFFLPEVLGQGDENAFMPRQVETTEKERRLYFFNKFQDFLQKREGCNQGAKGGLTFSDRCMTLCQFYIHLEQCYDDLPCILKETIKGKGMDLLNIENSDILNTLLDILKQSLAVELQKVRWWADPELDDETLNLCTGIMTYILQAIDDSEITQSADLSTYNTGATVMTPALAWTEFQKLYFNATIELKNTPLNESAIFITQAWYDLLLQYFLANPTQTCCTWDMTQNGISQLKFLGRPITPRPDWDTVMVGQLGYVKAYAGLYFAMKNLVEQFDTDRLGSDFKIIYDEITELLHIKGRFGLGFNFVHEKLLSVAI